MADHVETGGIFNVRRIGRRWLPVVSTVIIMAVIGFGMTACKPNGQSGEPHPKTGTGIHKIYTRGPVTCVIDTNRSKMTIADRLHLKITVVADQDYEVRLPPAGEKLSQFGIVGFHTTAPELTGNGKTRIIRTYVLDPFLSGKYNIPALTIHFWKVGEKKKGTRFLRTDDISIMVSALLPETLNKMKLHDIVPPVPLRRSAAIWIWAASLAGFLLAGFMAFYFVRTRRNAKIVSAIPYLAPHEQAYRELEQLVAEDLVKKGEIKAFYQKISGILRRYIENRFGIHAPEQTTDEFLTGSRQDTTFPETYHILLRTFLRHCDLVKFAAHQPSTEEIQDTLDSCKKFIAETRTTEMEPGNATDPRVVGTKD